MKRVRIELVLPSPAGVLSLFSKSISRALQLLVDFLHVFNKKTQLRLKLIDGVAFLQ